MPEGAGRHVRHPRNLRDRPAHSRVPIRPHLDRSFRPTTTTVRVDVASTARAGAVEVCTIVGYGGGKLRVACGHASGRDGGKAVVPGGKSSNSGDIIGDKEETRNYLPSALARRLDG